MRGLKERGEKNREPSWFKGKPGVEKKRQGGRRRRYLSHLSRSKKTPCPEGPLWWGGGKGRGKETGERVRRLRRKFEEVGEV